ncbi:hypothetical protein OAH12_01160 [Cyclobacteriaceae bacterium]|nr:hypothetical protein [Cyclobacteriaceae bacterium]
MSASIKITVRQIFKQLEADLIGKDSHRGVTLTYSWLANQFGHISLGFIPVILFQKSVLNLTKTSNSSLLTAALVASFWLLFETYNLLGPLIFSKKKHVFKPRWGNLVFDTSTDLLFFWFGAFSAALFLSFTFVNLIIVSILTLLLLYPSSFWFLTKMYQFYALYPFQFRLSQWSFRIGTEDKETIKVFLTEKANAHHLLIYGSLQIQERLA